jgi:Asp-tRNA(Asn)/Glu-tRNA(Gln) amidotransferase A subunit family amidase
VDKGGEAFSEVLRNLIAEGRTYTAVQYQRALEDTRNFSRALAEYLEDCNAIITPAAPGVAPKGLNATGSPIFSTLWTLSGLPTLSLPLLEGEGGLPIGVQLVGAPRDDARLLRTANWLVKQTMPKGRRRIAGA